MNNRELRALYSHKARCLNQWERLLHWHLIIKWLYASFIIICLFRKEAFTRQTVGKHVGKLLATNKACLYSRQLFHQLLRKTRIWRVNDRQTRVANFQHVCHLLLCLSHTPTWVCQHESVNFSLSGEGCLKSINYRSRREMCFKINS